MTTPSRTLLGGFGQILVAVPAAFGLAVFYLLRSVLFGARAGVPSLRRQAPSGSARPVSVFPAGAVEQDLWGVDSAWDKGIAMPASTTRMISFPGVGYLTLWAYRDRKLVKRQLTITDPLVAKQAGLQRTPLPEVQWADGVTLRAIEDVCIEQCRTFVQRFLVDGASAANASSKEMAAPPLVLVAPTLTPTPSAPIAVDSSAGAAPVARTAQGPRQEYSHPLESAVGVLQYAGIVSRTFDGRPDQHFAVDVDTAQGPRRLFGVDLERAVKESGATCGNRVEVKLVDRAAITLVNGQPGKRNIYTMRKLP